MVLFGNFFNNVSDAVSDELKIENVDKFSVKVGEADAINNINDLIADICQYYPEFFSGGIRREKSDLAHRIISTVEQIENQDFWCVQKKSTTSPCFIYESATGCLWDANPSFYADSEGVLNLYLNVIATQSGCALWRVPGFMQIRKFASNSNNPIRRGQNCRIHDEDYWIIKNGKIDLDSFSRSEGNFNGRVILLMETKNPLKLIAMMAENDWELLPVSLGATKISLDSLLDVEQIAKKALQELDFQSCRLPRLEPAQFSDPDKGLWEFWNATSTANPEGVRPRNPADDVRDWNVAIDFGTSSTVVAYDDNGQHKLLRIGVKDFFEAPQPRHYENPTVLEFIDFQALLHAWQQQAYRPAVRWDDVRCSHEALHNWRNNESNPQVVASILGKLKQWALRQEGDRPLRITDQKEGFEHELHLLQQRNPVKGSVLAVGEDDAFDPVELYAWFLGMNINWRQRRLFLRYYMTFPVAYSREVKERILASFRRGLQRSLPLTLVEQPEFLSRFCVEEIASEPAAYAAAALPRLGLEPSEKGLAYAVFDFGGGTTDFDFGIYRLPTPDEEDRGTEAVFEHFGNEGDRFLGGENLLENLAYRMFLHNLDECRAKKIAFSKPLDADDFPGSELFLEKTQAASTNTLMLMSRLRPLWEQGRIDNSSGVEKLSLLNREGEKVNCELAIPLEELQDWLEQRVEEGIRNFFIAMRKAFDGRDVAEIHILLAGNSSRSQLVAQFFGLVGDGATADTNAPKHRSGIEQLTGLAAILREGRWERGIWVPDGMSYSEAKAAENEKKANAVAQKESLEKASQTPPIPAGTGMHCHGISGHSAPHHRSPTAGGGRGRALPAHGQDRRGPGPVAAVPRQPD